MRRLRPASVRPVGYPRLTAGWRFLVGALPIALAPATSFADASLPHEVVRVPKNQPTPRPSHEDHPRMGGVIAMPIPPQPPTEKAKNDPKPKAGEKAKDPAPAKVAPTKLGAVLHPHGPDEPCLPPGVGLRVRV